MASGCKRCAVQSGGIGVEGSFYLFSSLQKGMARADSPEPFPYSMDGEKSVPYFTSNILAVCLILSVSIA